MDLDTADLQPPRRDGSASGLSGSEIQVCRPSSRPSKALYVHNFYSTQCDRGRRVSFSQPPEHGPRPANTFLGRRDKKGSCVLLQMNWLPGGPASPAAASRGAWSWAPWALCGAAGVQGAGLRVDPGGQHPPRESRCECPQTQRLKTRHLACPSSGSQSPKSRGRVLRKA